MISLKLKESNNTFSQITKLLVVVLIFVTIFFPSDLFGMKKISLILILVINFPIILSFFLLKKNIKYLFLIVLSPILLYLISLLTYFNPIENLKYFYVYSYLWIVPVFIEFDIDFKKYFMLSLNLMTFIILISVVLDVTTIYNVHNNLILNYLNDSGNAKISTSTNAIFHYVLFFNTSPLLIVLMLYQVNTKKYFMSILTLLALFFTGTRANIYTAVICFIVYYLFYEKSILKKCTVFLISILSLFVFKEGLLERIWRINDAKSYGDEIRRLTMYSIKEDIQTGNLFHKIFGKGPSKPYFNYGRMEISQFSELSYMELLRQIGYFGSFLFLILICDFFVRLMKNKKYWLAISLGSYLTTAIVDPFLFTSTGFILYSLCYFEILKGV